MASDKIEAPRKNRFWKWIRRILLTPLYLIGIVIIAVPLSGGVIYLIGNYARGNPCVKPFDYDIGKFDESWGISKEKFLEQIKKAELVWEKPLNKDLLNYKPGARFKINLIKNENWEIYYKALESEERYLKYLKEWDEWNKKGGPPPKVEARLDQEYKDILRVQELAGEVSGGTLIDLFLKGDRMGIAYPYKIVIKAYYDDKLLLSLLAHEIGHIVALNNPTHPPGDSVMGGSPVIASEADVKLTAADMRWREKSCADG